MSNTQYDMMDLLIKFNHLTNEQKEKICIFAALFTSLDDAVSFTYHSNRIPESLREILFEQIMAMEFMRSQANTINVYPYKLTRVHPVFYLLIKNGKSILYSSHDNIKYKDDTEGYHLAEYKNIFDIDIEDFLQVSEICSPNYQIIVSKYKSLSDAYRLNPNAFISFYTKKLRNGLINSVNFVFNTNTAKTGVYNYTDIRALKSAAESWEGGSGFYPSFPPTKRSFEWTKQVAKKTHEDEFESKKEKNGEFSGEREFRSLGIKRDIYEELSEKREREELVTDAMRTGFDIYNMFLNSNVDDEYVEKRSMKKSKK